MQHDPCVQLTALKAHHVDLLDGEDVRDMVDQILSFCPLVDVFHCTKAQYGAVPPCSFMVPD